MEILSNFEFVLSIFITGYFSDLVRISGIFRPTAFAYDMVYGKVTHFMQQAINQGCRVSDGLGMLVEQAADAFLLWRGAELAQQLNARAVLDELRQELAAKAP